MIDYAKAENWIVSEDRFNTASLGKTEAIMAQGNGYLGLRAATEESYLEEKRDCFVVGTFNKFDENEVTELPNAADIVAMKLTMDGELFSLTQGEIEEYRKELCIKNGELHRHIKWISPHNKKYSIDFYRIVSKKKLHVIAQKVIIIPLSKDANIELVTGIDGRMNNGGSQHFSDGEKRFYDHKYMQLLQKTTESGIEFVHNTVVKIEGDLRCSQPKVAIERRRIFCEYEINASKGQAITIEKISNVYTSRDQEYTEFDSKKLQANSLKQLMEETKIGYSNLLEESAREWEKGLWKLAPIEIVSENKFDLFALRFAQYHLAIMTPICDHRMNIAAKGLSGEGYKGHTFWDMDIFILPYYTFTMPKIAKKLLEYRYLSLPGARKKALENGFLGAQYPWESAWITDGEVTPLWGVVNIETGKPTRIWSGLKEQHITADVAYGVWQYDQVTDDKEFMEACGYEIIFETATFWASRFEYSVEDKLYHLCNVIGPDEYKEHVDDNAFTNYMAYWNMKQAITYSYFLEKENNDIFNILDKKIGIKNALIKWTEVIEKIYLPKPRKEDEVIPQDCTYLTYPDIDLTKYKKQEKIGSILTDYSIDQISHMQVSKQTDILMTFLLLEEMFETSTKEANWKYYEARTLHDSSLSLSSHCVLACDMKNEKLAYELFEKACQIDFGQVMNSSDEGVHAASLGGIWQCVVYGFGGIRMIDGKLRINPFLPTKWQELMFDITWKKQMLQIHINHAEFQVQNLTGKESVCFIHQSKKYHTEKSNVCVVK